jgi:hypothetical protein
MIGKKEGNMVEKRRISAMVELPSGQVASSGK